LLQVGNVVVVVVIVDVVVIAMGVAVIISVFIVLALLCSFLSSTHISFDVPHTVSDFS